jgi:hypothetical protein
MRYYRRMETTELLLRQIENFLRRTGMSASAFGQSALQNRNFVFALRKGENSPTLKTVYRVKDFMKDFRA